MKNKKLFIVPFIMVCMMTLSMFCITAKAEETNGTAWMLLDTLVQQYLSPELCSVDEYADTYTEEQLKEMTDDLDAYLADKDISTDRKKTEAISTYVAERIYYDMPALEIDTITTEINPYEVWKTKRSVCEGYANLLRTLLIAKGIPNEHLTSYLHGFNICYLADEQKWIYVDSTWMSSNQVVYGYDDSGEYMERWIKYPAKMQWFDADITTMVSDEKNYHLVWRINHLVKDGIIYRFQADENSGHSSMNLEKWKTTQFWNFEITGLVSEDSKDKEINNTKPPVIWNSRWGGFFSVTYFFIIDLASL